MKRPTLAERFWAKVRRGHGCWLWQGSCFEPSGYGNLSHENRTLLAHRVAWVIENGPIPEGLWILHRCDNPPCVRPSHLYAGTPKDNAQDKVRRGRWRGNQKLTELQVVMIKLAVRLYPQRGTIRTLAQECRVSHNAVADVARGKTWRSIAA